VENDEMIENTISSVKMKRNLRVNVYRVERSYGGSEEGGWWFDQGRFLESWPCTCECSLPIEERPTEDERGNQGWYAQLDTWVGHHEEGCNSLECYEKIEKVFSEHQDEWYPQMPEDDSDLRRGESLSTGKIQIEIELNGGKNFPEHMPHYS
jgi:hypothetical protein